MLSTPVMNPTPRLATVLLLLSSGLLACAGDAPPPADPASRRQVAQGLLVGHAARDAHAWLGIPFAAPPVGELRWRAPQPPLPWDGVREALGHGPGCPQLDPGGEATGDEDCLTLNVYAPATPGDDVPQGEDRLPVMVFIHGGGNTMGSAEVYDGSRLASENGVVVVTVQYRLGVLGWFSSPALTSGATTAEDASGNWGTLDLIRSLEWVRENVSAFGGDPERVTIFGESAGGVNVYSLLLSPRAKGLFHGAISQSGIVTSFSPAEAENAIDDPGTPGLPGSSTEVMLSLLEVDGRAASREEAKAVLASMSADEITSWLRAKPAAELFAPFQRDGGGFGGMYFAPFVFRDGHVVLDMDPMEAFRTGAHNAVPTIVGTNRDEHKLFQAFLSPHVRRLGPIPVGFRDEQRYDVVTEYGSRMWKATGADEPAAAMQASQEPAVFGYRFDWDEETSLLGVDLSRLIGAAHAIELLFVFGGTDSDLARRWLLDDAESAEVLSRQIRSYWAEFAATGDPGRGQSGDLPAWPAWQNENARFLVLDSRRDGGLSLSAETEGETEIVAGVATDSRLANAEQRCEVYAGFVQWSATMSEEDYAAVNGGECAAHPLASRTPFD